MERVHDAWRFWRRSFGRGLLLLSSCSLIVALAAVNTVVLRSSLWFTPPGVTADKSFVTLGQRTPEGRFEPVALRDLDRLGAWFARDSYAAYGTADADIRFGGRAWPARHVALVSDSFFGLLGVEAAYGNPPGRAGRGALLGYRFWTGALGGNRDVVGRTINVGGVDVPIRGIAPPQFKGLGDGEPDVWIPDADAAAFIELVLPLPPEVVQSVRGQFARQAPFFFGIVDASGGNADHALGAWKVRNNKEISLSTPSGLLLLGFDATGHTPAIYRRIDVNPDKTAVVARYLSILGVLNLSLVFLAFVNLVSFWSARTSERSQELQTMVAIGASRRDLLSMFAVEAAPLLVSIMVLAVPLAHLELHLLGFLGVLGDYMADRQVTFAAVDFLPGAGMVLGIAAIAVALPWHYVNDHVLKSRALGATVATRRLRNAAAWWQWALSAVVAGAVGLSLLVGMRLHGASWGGEADPVAVTLQSNAMSFRDDLATVLGIPASEVEVVGVPPLTRLQIRSQAYLAAEPAKKRTLYFNDASPGSFAALGLDVLAGEPYEAHSENRIVLGETAASLFAADPKSLVGAHIVRANAFDSSNDTDFVIAGIVEDVHYDSVQKAPEAVAYLPAGASIAGMTFLLPGRYRDPIRMLATTAVEGIDPGLRDALASAQTLSGKLSAQVRTELILALFTLGYALLALALMCLGLLSMARAQLQQQGRELGLRAALGASLSRSTWEFLRTPTVLALTAVAPVLTIYVALLGSDALGLPLVGPGDWAWILVIVAAILLCFEAALYLFVRHRLERYDLSELLRSER